MKNLKIKTILFLALCGYLPSCKKGGEQQSIFFPQTLYFTQLSAKTGVRVFTKNGQITDPIVIARFIKNTTNFNLQNQAIDANDKLIFTSKSNVLFGVPGVPFDLNSGFASTKTEFIFHSQKQNTVNTQSLAYKLLKFKAPLKTIGTAPTLTYTSPEVRVAYGNYLDLNFSVLSYKIAQDDGITLETQTNIVSNQAIDFNAAFLAQLPTIDTIAVQEFIYNYKVK
jgi:hypothetical protein